MDRGQGQGRPPPQHFEEGAYSITGQGSGSRGQGGEGQGSASQPPPSRQEDASSPPDPESPAPSPPPPAAPPTSSDEKKGHQGDEGKETNDGGKDEEVAGQGDGKDTLGDIERKGKICLIVSVVLGLIFLIIVIALSLTMLNQDDEDEVVEHPVPVDKRDKTKCRLENGTDGSLHRSFMIKCERNRETEFDDSRCRNHTIFVKHADEKSCKVRFLLVGGGGGSRSEAGGGSGYLEYVDEVDVEHNTPLYVKAGEQRRHSILQIGPKVQGEDPDKVHDAKPGFDAAAGDLRGGNGYCGGGGAGGFIGGYDGGDGDGIDDSSRGWGLGGEGDGTKVISEFNFKTWKVNPGWMGEPLRYGITILLSVFVACICSKASKMLIVFSVVLCTLGIKQILNHDFQGLFGGRRRGSGGRQGTDRAHQHHRHPRPLGPLRGPGSGLRRRGERPQHGRRVRRAGSRPARDRGSVDLPTTDSTKTLSDSKDGRLVM